MTFERTALLLRMLSKQSVFVFEVALLGCMFDLTSDFGSLSGQLEPFQLVHVSDKLRPRVLEPSVSRRC